MHSPRSNFCELTSWLMVGYILFASLPTSAQADLPTRVQFNEHIRPILSDRCFACHGPDENKREADLRLDLRDGATADLGDYAAIVPGQPDASELFVRVTSHDPDVAMPPPSSKKSRLTANEIALLKRWIEQGAEYQGHWSLQPMGHSTPPSVSLDTDRRYPRPIDRFVIQKLREQNLKSLSPQASKERLVRRVTFDLTGLPPTHEEIDAFLADESPQAYERVVDRLLASPRYGERMASDWLDVARFADSHGYQMDRYRPMWPYRDWVIKAFNENLPYDKFVTWQLAGDLLLNATKEQRLATAFNRLHCQNEEGGIVDEEFRVAYVNDRVTTFGTAFLGLTLECARCHDHKYDPITQRDFYSLFAFFQNISESGQTSYFTDAMPTPTLLLSTDEQDARLAELRDKIAACEETASKMEEEANAEFEVWLAARPAESTISDCVAHFPFDAIQRRQTPNTKEGAKPGKAVEGPEIVEGKIGKAVKLNGENGFTFPEIADFTRADPFSISLWIRPPKLLKRGVILHHSKAPADAASRGYDLCYDEGRLAFGLYHFWPGNALKVRTKSPVATAEWTHVVVTYDGSSRASGLKLYLNGDLEPADVLRDDLTKDITYSDNGSDLTLGHRFRDSGFTGGDVDELQIFHRQLTSLEAGELAGEGKLATALTVLPDSLTRENRADLRAYFLATTHEPYRKALADLQAARSELAAFVNPIPEAMVMEELPQSKPSFVLNRGSYDQPTTPVSATTPAALPPMAEGAPRNRLGLSEWLLDPEHPLTARVAVNRLWQMMFDSGLVETSDNFGSQGSAPTHPELLDWLARDYIDSGWDTKRMLKQIAMSETYRQSSQTEPSNIASDPSNRWLCRAPVRRLTAEMLRDQALFAGGLLHESLGGPSVKPYQPDGLWDIAMGEKVYETGKGTDLYRRSLYTYWRRTLPPPAMAAFDAADRSYCTVQRQSTSTPLQALALLNDPQIVEAARKTGERMLLQDTLREEDRVAWVFRLITSQEPTPAQLAVLSNLYREQQAIFASDEAAAQKLLAVGESKANERLSKADAAAATVLALAIFNFDEAVQRR